jgi:hypothetical protein
MRQNRILCQNLPGLVCGLLLGACGPGPPSTLPDAPPPWQEVSVPNDATDPHHGLESPKLGNPSPPRPSWRDRFSPSSTPSHRPTSTYSSTKVNYNITAYASVWVLVQDKKGNELEWISMKAGDEVPVMHRGPLTITCSSGTSVKITDKNGKKIDPATNSNGISIVRLP